MGTNYYIKLPDHEEELHIGKSSAGWVFSLRLHSDLGISTLYDWLPVFFTPMSKIFDEYGTPISRDELISTIVKRGRIDPPDWSEEEYLVNHAMPGPNNLVRHIPDEYGTSLGEGTWDYCDYEFC